MFLFGSSISVLFKTTNCVYGVWFPLGGSRLRFPLPVGPWAGVGGASTGRLLLGCALRSASPQGCTESWVLGQPRQVGRGALAWLSFSGRAPQGRVRGPPRTEAQRLRAAAIRFPVTQTL